MASTGIITRMVWPAGERVSGKDRGEWMKLTDEEARLIQRLRNEHSPHDACHCDDCAAKLLLAWAQSWEAS